MASEKVGLPNAWSFRSKGPGGAEGGRSATPTAIVTAKARGRQVERGGVERGGERSRTNR
jgi:hypothetical protein